MNRLDKLLLIARSNAKYNHVLVCVLIPEADNKYAFNVSLQKNGKIMEYSTNYFSNKEQCDNFITDFCKRYRLTDSNTLKIYLNAVPASNEVL